MNQIGEVATDFNLPDEKGNYHRLTDYKGQCIILYFYPKDNTPGCTKQALEFKRLYTEYLKKNSIIIGISKDSIQSHQKFKEKYELPFLLLSDSTLEVINQYGVFQEKMMYGKKTMGVVRTTLIIDENGLIVDRQEKVHSGLNPQETLCKLN